MDLFVLNLDHSQRNSCTAGAKGWKLLAGQEHHCLWTRQLKKKGLHIAYEQSEHQAGAIDYRRKLQDVIETVQTAVQKKKHRFN